MLRILRANNINISSLLPPHTLTPITQLLNRTPHLHAARLSPSSHAEAVETRNKVADARTGRRAEGGEAGPHAGTCWCVDVLGACAERGAQGLDGGGPPDGQGEGAG